MYLEKQKEDQVGNEFRRQTETVEYLEKEKLLISTKVEEAVNNKNIQNKKLNLLLTGIEEIFRFSLFIF